MPQIPSRVWNVPADVRVYQDSPEYGCDDNPSYLWYAYRSVNGHIVNQSGGHATAWEAVEAVKKVEAVNIPCFECHNRFGHKATCSKYMKDNY